LLDVVLEVAVLDDTVDMVLLVVVEVTVVVVSL
jgi:hypothetical protein